MLQHENLKTIRIDTLLSELRKCKNRGIVFRKCLWELQKAGFFKDESEIDWLSLENKTLKMKHDILKELTYARHEHHIFKVKVGHYQSIWFAKTQICERLNIYDWNKSSIQKAEIQWQLILQASNKLGRKVPTPQDVQNTISYENNPADTMVIQSYRNRCISVLEFIDDTHISAMQKDLAKEKIIVSGPDVAYGYVQMILANRITA